VTTGTLLTPSTAPAPRRRGLRSWYRRGGLASIFFALPVILVFAYFSWGPIARGLTMSWQKTNLVDPASWVGWANFEYVLQNPLLGQAALNTVWFVVLGLLIGFPLPLFLAVFISELRGTKPIYSVLSYLPVVIPPVVAILLWKVFYDASPTGVFNTILGWVGIGPLPFLNSPTMAMPSLVLESTWASAGSTVIIYLAAMASVRGELYEAAELDGAGIWRKIWSITLPQLRGVILIVLLLQIIGTTQVFAEPFLFTGGGPNNATTTILLLIFNYAFVFGDYGAASALSALLAAVLAVVSIVYFWATRRWSDA
jgi:ABC-type sugar transport systems, permease components